MVEWIPNVESIRLWIWSSSDHKGDFHQVSSPLWASVSPSIKMLVTLYFPLRAAERVACIYPKEHILTCKKTKCVFTMTANTGAYGSYLFVFVLRLLLLVDIWTLIMVLPGCTSMSSCMAGCARMNGCNCLVFHCKDDISPSQAIKDCSSCWL